jgi:deoxyribonucleoside regulator
MKKNEDTLLLYRIANYYYNENMSQNEIAYIENVSRSQISRLLIKAREMGLVKISVELPNMLSTQNMEQQLQLTLGLQNVIVIETSDHATPSPDDTIKALSTAVSNYLPLLLGNAKHIGIGWGKTIYSTSLLLPITNSVNGRIFVPLIGNSGSQNPYLQTSAIVNRFSEKFLSRGFYLNLPCVQEQNTLLSAYEDICIKQLNMYWDSLDAAVFSLGIIPDSRNVYIAELPKSAINLHSFEQITGEILGRTYNKNGEDFWIWVDGYEFIGISLDKLKSIENTICIAGGMDKVIPIISAAKNGYFKTLITDDVTANIILNEYSS